jgi:hypothetical protein
VDNPCVCWPAWGRMQTPGAAAHLAVSGDQLVAGRAFAAKATAGCPWIAEHAG